MKVKATLSLPGATCLVDSITLSYRKCSCLCWPKRKVLARYSFPWNAWIPRPAQDTLHNSSDAFVDLPLDKLMKKDGETLVKVCCKASRKNILVSYVSLADLLAMLRRTKRGDEAVLIFELSGVMEDTGIRYTALFCNGQRCVEKSRVLQELLLPENVPRKTVQKRENEGVNDHQDNTEDSDDSEQISNSSTDEEDESLTWNSGDDNDSVMSTLNMAAHTITDCFYGSEERNRNQEYCTDDSEEDEDVYFLPPKALLTKWWDECMKQTTNPDITPRHDEEITDQPRHHHNKNTSYTNWKKENNRPQYTDHTYEERDHTCSNRRNTNGGRTHTNKKDHYNINSNINTNMARRYDNKMYLQEDEGYLNKVDKYCHQSPEERAYFGHSGTYWNCANGYKAYTDYNNRGNIRSNTSRHGYIRRRRNKHKHTRLPRYNQETSAVKSENIPIRFWLQCPIRLVIHRSAYVRVLGVVVAVVVLLLYLIGLWWISW